MTARAGNRLLAPGCSGLKTRALAFLRAIAWLLVNNTLMIPLTIGAIWLQRHIAGFPDLTWPLRDGKIDAGALAGAECIPLLACLLTTLGFSAFSVRTDENWGRAFIRNLNCRRPNTWKKGALIGALSGLVAIMFAFGCEYALGGYRVLYAAQPGQLLSLSVFAFGFLIVGITEETATRGYLQNSLTDSIGFLPAAVLTSVWFGYEHLIGPDPLIGIPQVVLFALFGCATLWLTGSLRFMIGFHAAWDWGQTAFFGTNDSGFPAHGALFHSVPCAGIDLISGGDVGPEGGLPAITLWLALAILAWVLAWKRRFSSQLP